MKNKTLILVTWLSLVGTIIGLVALALKHQYSHIIINSSGSLFLLTGIYLLLKNGSFIQSREFKLSGLGVALVILGAMLKIMHWSFAYHLLAMGLIIICTLYLIHFIRKQNKKRMDWGKFLFIILFFTGRFFSISHWPYAEELNLFSTIVFILVVLRHIKQTQLNQNYN